MPRPMKPATVIAALAIATTVLTGCTVSELKTAARIVDTLSVPVTSSPTPSVTLPVDVDPTLTPAPPAATTASLNSLAVAPPADGGDYRRTDQFGRAWLDVDNNGCDTRNDILNRDLVSITFKYAGDTCIVQTGTLHDPYLGKTIGFERGDRSTDVQIDHIIPLKYAWIHGAQTWTQDKRVALANDPINLLAVDGPTNSSKGAKGPENWMPLNAAFTCQYATDFINVTAKYSLSITSADKRALAAALSRCGA